MVARHILCENNGRMVEAMGKLRSGMNSVKVATRYSDESQDRGRHGLDDQTVYSGAIRSSSYLACDWTDEPVFTDPPVKSEYGHHVSSIVEGRV